MKAKKKVLFLCTGNSCRSQMAEGWARHLKGADFDGYSAGIEVHGLNPLAVKVMGEVGIDISGHRSRHVNEFQDTVFDYVVTVCDHAYESCPHFPGNCKVIHVGFDDPPRMAREGAAKGATEEEQLQCYRDVRDRIGEFIETLPEYLADGGRE